MPGCSDCGGGTTSTVITAGAGISVSGVGTARAPYHFELDTLGEQLTLEVRDSATINFRLYGSGAPGDPYVLTGDTGSATALTGLSDYSSADLPNDTEVLTWVGTSTGGHWEPRLLPPTVSPTTNAAQLTAGTLDNARLSGVLVDRGNITNADWNSLLVAGMYRVGPGAVNGPPNAYGFGTLVVFVSSASVSQQYLSHGSGYVYVRTKWNASDWSSWNRQAVQADIDPLASQVNALNQSVATWNNGASTAYTALSTGQDAVNRANGAQATANAAYNNADGAQRTANAAVNAINGTSVAHNLGNASKIMAGGATVNNFTAGANGYQGFVDIVFYNAFNSVGAYQATARSADSGGVVASVENPTLTSMRIYVQRRNAVATGVYWTVIGD